LWCSWIEKIDGEPEAGDLWMLDAERGALSRLPGKRDWWEYTSIWSPDNYPTPFRGCYSLGEFCTNMAGESSLVPAANPAVRILPIKVRDTLPCQ
jgi:hypothetical protein